MSVFPSKIFLIAGEPSGDSLGAALMDSLREKFAGNHIFGYRRAVDGVAGTGFPVSDAGSGGYGACRKFCRACA